MNPKLQHIVRCVYDHSTLELRNFDKQFSVHGNEVVVEGLLVCSACGREYPIIDEIVFIAEDELIENLPVVKQFRSCHLLSTQPVKKVTTVDVGVLQEVQSFWSERPSAGRWDDEVDQMEGLERWRVATLPWLESLSGYSKHAGELMLEVGAGQGLCTYRFAQGRAHVVSLDLSYSLLIAQRRIRRKELSEYVDFVIGNAENLPFQSSQFDYLYSHGVIHHSRDSYKCISEIYRVMKKDAQAFVMYYHTWSLTKLLEGIAKMIYKILKKITGDEQTFLKLCRLLFKGYSDKQFENFLETGKSATLHAPIIQTFSKRQSLRMFSQAGFSDIRMTLKHLNEEVALMLNKLHLGFMNPWLEGHFGWDLIITAKKGK